MDPLQRRVGRLRQFRGFPLVLPSNRATEGHRSRVVVKRPRIHDLTIHAIEVPPPRIKASHESLLLGRHGRPDGRAPQRGRSPARATEATRTSTSRDTQSLAISECASNTRAPRASVNQRQKNLLLRLQGSRIRCNMSRPAFTAATSGANGERPAAIRSAFTKSGQSASFGRSSVAKVVLPAPLGPAMMRIRLARTIHASRSFLFSGLSRKAMALFKFRSSSPLRAEQSLSEGPNPRPKLPPQKRFRASRIRIVTSDLRILSLPPVPSAVYVSRQTGQVHSQASLLIEWPKQTKTRQEIFRSAFFRPRIGAGVGPSARALLVHGLSDASTASDAPQSPSSRRLASAPRRSQRHLTPFLTGC